MADEARFGSMLRRVDSKLRRSARTKSVMLDP
jgi:hypothetical protein